MTDSLIVTLLIVSAVLFLIFLLLRELNCWYWKINEIIKLLSRIEAKLPNQAVDAPPTSPASPTSAQETKQTVNVECPHCHKSEEMEKNSLVNPDAYSLFKATYNPLSLSVKLVCNECGTKFRIPI